MKKLTIAEIDAYNKGLIENKAKPTQSEADSVYMECYNELMEYNLDALEEIAYTQYGITEFSTKHELAEACASIEVGNYLK